MIENLNVRELGERLEKYLHPVSASKEPEILFALAATAYENKIGENLENKIRDLDTKNYVKNFAERYSSAIETACKELSNDELKNFVIFGEKCINHYGSLPSGVSDLIIRLTEVKSGDIFLNVAGGSEICFKNEIPDDTNLIGIEQNISTCRIIYICSAVTGRSVQVRMKSVLEPGLDWLQANKVFINLPALNYRESGANVKEKIKTNPALMKIYGDKEPEVSVWNFVLSALESQMQPGKTVALLTNRDDLINDKGEYFRRGIVKNGRLEAVIALPEKIIHRFHKFYLMIFSQNNEKVKLVDASDIYRDREKN